jgi:hypothetical protein
MRGNDFIIWLLRSPFHGILSNGMMLVTVTGRKTGKNYTLPVEYYRENGYLWVMTSRDRTWWRNLRGGAKAALLLKRKPITAFAEPELNENIVAAQIRNYLQRRPQAAKPLGIRVKDGILNAGDVERFSRERLFVKIKPF